MITQDLRYSFRMMRRSPILTGVALVLMALGIGANTAVFSVVNEVLLRRLPVSHPEELVELETDDTANHVAGSEFSYPAFELFSSSNALTSGMFARSEPVQVEVMDGGISGIAQAVFDTWSAPTVLGLRPALGRLSNSGDAQASAQTPPVFLSYGYWQKRFGGASSVIGKTVAIDTIPFVIAGVYPANFHGIAVGIEPEIVLPVYMADRIRGIPTLHNPNSWGFTILCRRKPGVTPEQLRSGLTPTFEAVLANFVAHEPPGMGGTFRRFASHLRFRVGSASLGASSGTRNQLRSPLTILMVITALVFLLTCANLAGLILTKTEGRMSEIGIRLAIGSAPGCSVN